jgi:hypothetical protein
MKKLTLTLFVAAASFCTLATDANDPKTESINVVAENSDCDPPFKIEGMNDAKGEYVVGKESWTIHFYEDGFIAFHTRDGKKIDERKIAEIKSFSKCKYGVMMEGVSGEMVPSWTLVYNEAGKFYDLHVHNYDAESDTWSDKVFAGSSDNG